MKKVLFTIIGLVFIALLVQTTGLFNLGGDDFESEIYFRGSSTLAPVISQAADTFVEEYGTWDQVDSEFPNEEIEISVTAGGSGAGVAAVADDVADFGMLAREARESEQEKINDYKEYQVAIDALTVSVNPANEIDDNITTKDIQAIFSSEYESWSQISEELADEEIIVVTRDLGGGAHSVFQNEIMGDIEVASSVIQAPSMGALVDRIIANEQAIGYASFGVANRNEDDVKPLKIDGVEPSLENIIDGTYTVSRPLLMVKDGDNSETEAAFLDFLFSETGEAIIEKMGFIPLD